MNFNPPINKYHTSSLHLVEKKQIFGVLSFVDKPIESIFYHLHVYCLHPEQIDCSVKSTSNKHKNNTVLLAFPAF